MSVVIGTAGHIDHGKTTLLRALTGIDADRLPEEQRRGMTIDVGYAHLVQDDGEILDFVDVPGHDRLIGNMLVGAGEIDAAMLVVAADDGPRAQTIEHLELLDALAICDAIVVVTKTDAVDAARATEVAATARDLVASTSLAGAEVVVVSAPTGAGLPELRATLAALASRVRARGLPGGPGRLAIDRVFRIKGRGIVVTGTLRGEALSTGAVLTVMPGGWTIRVRELQVHGGPVERASPGRVAINVAGDERGALARGLVLTTDPDALVASDRWLVALRPTRAGVLPSDRTRAQVHAGTARTGAAVGRAGRDGVDLGDDEASAILRLETPLAVAPGDRFVLRRPSPPATLAGGRVLDAMPPRGVARRRSTGERLFRLARAVPPAAEWTSARVDLHGAADGRLAPDVADALDATLIGAVAEAGEIAVARLRDVGARGLRHKVAIERAEAARLASEAVDHLVAAGGLARDADRVRPAGSVAIGLPPEVLAAMDRLEAALATPAPPPLTVAARMAGCSPAGVRELERTRRIVRLDDDLAWAFGTYRELTATALALAGATPLTPAVFRDATGTSRKYVMAILEDLDRRAILRRTEAGHVPGPRAPQPALVASRGGDASPSET
jgi:selenocysteine-specific elongation factor